MVKRILLVSTFFAMLIGCKQGNQASQKSEQEMQTPPPAQEQMKESSQMQMQEEKEMWDLVGESNDVLKIIYEGEDVICHFKNEEFKLMKQVSASGNIYKNIYKNDTYELTQHQGETILTKEGKEIFVQKPQTIKGRLSFAHEADVFSPCGGDGNKAYWFNDMTDDLKSKYDELTQGQKPGTEIFIEAKAVVVAKSEDGFDNEFDGVYNIVKVETARKYSEKDCK